MWTHTPVCVCVFHPPILSGLLTCLLARCTFLNRCCRGCVQKEQGKGQALPEYNVVLELLHEYDEDLIVRAEEEVVQGE